MENCCPGFEADEAFEMEQRKALYATTHLTQKTKVNQPNQLYSTWVNSGAWNSQTGMRPSHSRVNGSSPLILSNIQQLHQRNFNLRRQVQTNKIKVWKQANHLYHRSQVLRQEYIVKNDNLGFLVAEINKYF